MATVPGSLFLLVSLSAAAAAPGSVPASGGRVVSLLPSYTELVYALGAGGELVGVSNYCSRPPEAAGLPRVGDYYSPDIERIYSLRPDLVLSGDWRASRGADRLSALGVKVVRLPEERAVEDLYRTVRLIAAALGREKEGKALNARIKKEFAAARYGGRERLKVYIEVDEGGWAAGGSSFISSLASLAGADNIFSAEKGGYFQASWESVVRADPDAIICAGGSAAAIKARPMAEGLRAVRSGAVLCGLDRDLLVRLTPSSPAAVRQLREALDAFR